MLTDFWVERQRVDLYSDVTIKHTLQVNDIAELKDRQASFTNSFSVPKTPNNVQIFKGLGIPSDTSRMPYLKPDCKLKYEGFDLIMKGWMNVTETDDDYKIYVYSGIINFFKAIENKTLGNDLDLSEINHTKDLLTVINSYLPSSPYRYFIADYNGQTHWISDPNIINIDYMVPSVLVKYLWDKIHSGFGFDYEGDVFTSADFLNWWMTYPKAPNIADLYKLISSGNDYRRYNLPIAQAENFANQHMRLFLNNIDAGSLAWRYGQYLDIAEDGTYRITFEVTTTNPVGTNFGTLNYWLGINSEGINLENITNKVILVTTNTATTTSREFFIQLTAGSVLQMFFKKEFVGGTIWIDSNYKIKVEKVNKENVNFQDGLNDFLITDFVKEVVNKCALTIFSSENSNLLTYETISERIRTDNVIDWSDKFIARTNEEYVATNYAQRNFFQFQYNDKEGTYYDGYINVANQNIDATKTIFKSKTYAPERIKTSFHLNNTTDLDVDVFKFYDKQANDNPDNPPSYKGLEKRFYFIKQADGTYSVNIGSDATNEQQLITNAIVGTFSGLDWQNAIGKYYGDYVNILNDSRVHSIDLNLDLIDIIQLDFKKLYYLKQEQQYYILNKVNFDRNKSSGEFIRVKKLVTNDPTNVGIAIDWIDSNIGSTTTWNHYIAVATLTGTPTYIWQTRLNNGPWIDATPNVLNYDYQFAFGINDLRVSYNNGFFTGFSNVLSYERKIETDPNKCYRFSFTSLQALPRTIEIVNFNNQITTVVLTFSTPTEIKNIDAKAIINMGGATLVNQIIITCPPVVCRVYRTERFLASGDDLWISYVDCNGVNQYEFQTGPTGSVGQWVEFNRCARVGTVSTNGTLTEGVLC